MRFHARVPLALGLSLLSSSLIAEAADWPNFRGPNWDGISQEAGVLTNWPADGPKVLWKVPVGEGYSQVVTSKGRLYTLAGVGNQEVALAFDAASGKKVWSTPIDRKLISDQGNGPRSTPTIDGDTLFALSGQGKLAALKTANGQKVWEIDLRERFGARAPNWGISTSPLVEGNLLLVNVGGGAGHSIVAFDRKTGRKVWAAESDPASYSTPIAITVRGVRQVVFLTGDSIVGLSPANGKVLWKQPWQTYMDINAASPIFFPPDKLYVSSGYDVGAGLFQIRVQGQNVTAQEVWRSRGMKNQFSSSVLHNGILYGFDNATLKAIDAATGNERWKQRGFGHGSLILAGGHLIVLSDRGKLALVEATPEAYRERGSAQMLSGKCWTAPTLAGGRLYLRNEEEMVALDWSAAKKAAPARTGR